MLLALRVTGCAGDGNEPADSSVRGKADRPNIVFILIDTLRADRLGAYGNARRLSPTMDEIAAEGVVFEHVVAQAPWTQPSMASIFCSVHPSVHKVLRYVPPSESRKNPSSVCVLPDGFSTLAELLRDRGYDTAAFVANPMMRGEYGFGQGFDVYDASFAKNSTPGQVVNEACFKWLEKRQGGKPFFVYLHYMDAHGPYNAGPEHVDDLLGELEKQSGLSEMSEKDYKMLRYLRKPPPVMSDPAQHDRLSRYHEYWQARYDAGVRACDRAIAELRDHLKGAGLWDNAYVVVTADHGEALGEHVVWGHGWTLHDTDLRVPLIMRWPGKLPAGRRVAPAVRLIDLAPTFIEQLGMRQVGQVQGVSLAALWEDAGRREWLPGFSECVKIGVEQKSICMGDWKLILTPRNNRRQLFNIAQDPMEKHNVAATYPQEAARLEAALRSALEENIAVAAKVQAQNAIISPEEVERLKSIGYMGGE